MKLVSLVNPEYWIALETLAWSLSRNGKIEGLEWIVIWDGPAVDGWYEWMRFCGFYPRYLSVDDFSISVPEFPVPKGSHVQPARNKLLVWLLPPDDIYVLLDVDMVCKQNARELLTLKPTCAHKRPGVNDFCSGMLVIEPSSDAFNEMINDIIPNQESWKFADQEIINIYYNRHGWKRIPWKWNLSHYEERRQFHWHKLFKEAIFVHYHGSKKPWHGLTIGQEQSFLLWHTCHTKALEDYRYKCKKSYDVKSKRNAMEAAYEIKEALEAGKKISVFEEKSKTVKLFWK